MADATIALHPASSGGAPAEPRDAGRPDAGDTTGSGTSSVATLPVRRAPEAVRGGLPSSAPIPSAPIPSAPIPSAPLPGARVAAPTDPTDPTDPTSPTPATRPLGDERAGTAELARGSAFRTGRRTGPLPLALARLALAGTLVGLVALLFVRIMSYAMRRDEQLYVSPAALLGDKSLYADLFYNHSPLSAWLFHAAADLSGLGLLASGRLVVFGGWLALLGVAAWGAWVLTRSLPVVVFAVAALVANDYLLGVVGMTATNNFLPLPLLLAGATLFVLGLRAEASASALFLAGLALALAASTKVSALAAVPPLAAATVFVPRAARLPTRLVRGTLPFAAGGVVGALPVLVPLASDPELVLAHIVGFHTTVHVEFWRMTAAEGVPAIISPRDKLIEAHGIWLGGANLVLVVAAVAIAALVWLDRDRALRGMTGMWAVITAAGLAALMALVPTPSFPQYFAAPVVLGPLIVAFAYARLAPARRPAADAVLLGMAAVVVLVGLPHLTRHAGRIVSPDAWEVARVERDGQALASLLGSAGDAGKVATLLPIYPLEGGLAVYDELATGQFAYRVAAMTSPDLRRHWSTTSPDEVGDLLASDPPAALLVGFEPELERPLVAYAEDNGYVRVRDFAIRDRYGIGVVYLRPDLAASRSAIRLPMAERSAASHRARIASRLR